MVVYQEHNQWFKSHWFIFFILVMTGLFLRWFNLDLRPIHHDESLHAVYSHYFFSNPDTGYYKYNPLLHGPVLYHTIPWSYYFFGITKFSVRFPAALLGTFMIFFPLLFKNKLQPYVVLLITSFISLSPSLVYWSRFIRHDYFVIFSLLIFIWGCFSCYNVFKIPVIFFSLALHLCIKENFYVHFVILLVYIFFEQFVYSSFKVQEKSTLQYFLQLIKEHWISFFLGLGLMGLTYTYFYSAGFRYDQGITDGFFNKSFTYWFEQHSQERIAGPFSYTFLVNSLYDFWWFFLLTIHILFFYKDRNWLSKLGFLFSIMIGFLFQFMFKDQGNILRIKIPLDAFLFFPLIYHSVLSTTINLIDKNRKEAISGYFFFALLFTYSYLGEKVPWLAIYSLIAGGIYFTFFFSKRLSQIWLIPFLALLFFTGYKAWQINHIYDQKNLTLLHQVQTNSEYEVLLSKIRTEMDQGSTSKLLLALDSNTWPGTFYFLDRSEYHYQEGSSLNHIYQHILSDDIKKGWQGIITENYDYQLIPMRSWWLPNWDELSFSKFFTYIWNHRAWSSIGTKHIYHFQKK